ncbi:c-type cytochrome [Prochlorococcus marinus]|uniref:Cytochrome cM n=1 Tax=Prochlorococcus marinus (strain MIT 9211) TaxID=93059 RepID=A9BB52_PROM4|nr:cytochrome c [Prochlorococcus marinus]ABX09064.1 cytochrome cM [Prochlorococcus marinus str. MIT 9211]
MKRTSPIGIEDKRNPTKGLLALIIISATSCLIILSWLFIYLEKGSPYIQNSLELNGSIEKGGNLFRMNCVGCHGISAQGLVGPDLNNVTNQLSDERIINQVIKGLTPPMPSFEMDPQSMADLLSYLHSLN